MRTINCRAMCLVLALSFSGGMVVCAEKTQATQAESVRQEQTVLESSSLKAESEEETATQQVTVDETKIAQDTDADLSQSQNINWIQAVYHEITTESGTYSVEEQNLVVISSNSEKKILSGNLMCDYTNGRYYLIYDDGVVYYPVEMDGMHKIMAYDENTGVTTEIYSEPYQDVIVGDQAMPNYLYPVGKWDKYLVYVDNSYMQDSEDEKDMLVILNLENKDEKKISLSYYTEGAYIQAAYGTLILSNSDGGYANLFAVDMETGAGKQLCEKCRAVDGDYMRETTVYYMEKRAAADQTYYLVGYELVSGDDCQRVELIGEWYERQGCFWGKDLQGNSYVVTYDGKQYPYDGNDMSLNQLDDCYIDCTSDSLIRKLDETTAEWIEWIDLKSYGINIPQNFMAIHLEKAADKIRVSYTDENYQQQNVLIDKIIAR